MIETFISADSTFVVDAYDITQIVYDIEEKSLTVSVTDNKHAILNMKAEPDAIIIAQDRMLEFVEENDQFVFVEFDHFYYCILKSEITSISSYGENITIRRYDNDGIILPLSGKTDNQYNAQIAVLEIAEKMNA